MLAGVWWLCLSLLQEVNSSPSRQPEQIAALIQLLSKEYAVRHGPHGGVHKDALAVRWAPADGLFDSVSLAAGLVFDAKQPSQGRPHRPGRDGHCTHGGEKLIHNCPSHVGKQRLRVASMWTTELIVVRCCPDMFSLSSIGHADLP
jgi:hypothetical protein